MIMEDNVPRDELAQRIALAQEAMAVAGFDALFISGPFNLNYYAGFSTPFTVSLTRPYFLLIPAAGAPIAVVPELVADLFAAQSGLADIRTWASPRPSDEGLSELASALAGLPRRTGVIGAELGAGTRLGMPSQDFSDLCRRLEGKVSFVDSSSLIRQQRAIKSAYEAGCIARACTVASEAYEAVPSLLARASSLQAVCRQFAAKGLTLGADDAPFVTAEKGSSGYFRAIAPPSSDRLSDGDVVVIDCGLRAKGYFCDFNRNWSIGHSDDATDEAYRRVFAATDIGIQHIRIGATLGELWASMAAYLGASDAPTPGGRMGHGLGLELTEEPSIQRGSEVVIRPGMVLCIEPVLVYGERKVMLHEEVVHVTDTGPALLTRRAPAEMPVVARQ